MTIKISTRNIFRTLCSITAVLFVLHVLLQYIRWELGLQDYTELFARFDLDNEISVPTWYSQFLFLLAAILSLAIGTTYKKINSTISRHYWTVIGCVFIFLSIDDGAMLHEQLNEPMRSLLAYFGLGEILDTPWVIAGLLFVALFVAYFARFLYQLDTSTRNQFILAGAVFVAGAIGVELISTQYGGLAYKLVVAVEETLEMLGVIIFIRALLLHLKARASDVVVQIV